MAFLISEEIEEPIKSIVEEVTPGTKSYYLDGVFMQDSIPNRNNRTYPKNLLQREATRYTEEFINKNRAWGELSHPTRPNIDLKYVSHRFLNLHENGNFWEGRARVCDNDIGRNVKAFIDEGAVLGMSTRGVGTIKTVKGVNVVSEDYKLCTPGDIVADPSVTTAFVRGIMEDVEWFYDSGMWISKPSEMKEIKEDVEKSFTRKQKAVSEQERLKALHKYFSILSN